MSDFDLATEAEAEHEDRLSDIARNGENEDEIEYDDDRLVRRWNRHTREAEDAFDDQERESQPDKLTLDELRTLGYKPVLSKRLKPGSTYYYQDPSAVEPTFIPVRFERIIHGNKKRVHEPHNLFDDSITAKTIALPLLEKINKQQSRSKVRPKRQPAPPLPTLASLTTTETAASAASAPAAAPLPTAPVPPPAPPPRTRRVTKTPATGLALFTPRPRGWCMWLSHVQS